MRLFTEQNLFLLIKLAHGNFFQINCYESFLRVKFYFESIGDKFEVIGLFFLLKNQRILMKTEYFFEK